MAAGNPIRSRPRGRPKSNAELDLAVVHWQFQALRIVIAGSCGAILGGLWQGWLGGILVAVAACIVVALRMNALTATTGLAAGGFAGWLYNAEQWQLPVLLGGALGLAVGICLGEWRKMWAPPGSG
jgi:hypothetical protein